MKRLFFGIFALGITMTLSLGQEPASMASESVGGSSENLSQSNSIAPKEGIASSSVVSARKYCSVPVEGSYIALTFDDGPSEKLTPKLLDLLKAKGIKATFFVIGENAANHPEIVARAAAEGHEIANHTWNHPRLTRLSDEQIQEEVNKTSEVIFKAIGKKPSLLRPPYGDVNSRVSHLVADQDGMKIILWSVDPNDWKRPGSAVVAQRLIAGASPGAIMLSHDIHAGTIEAMPTVIDALLAKGYHFVTVSELLAMETKNPQPVRVSEAASTGVSAVPHKKHQKRRKTKG